MNICAKYILFYKVSQRLLCKTGNGSYVFTKVHVKEEIFGET